MVVLGGRAVSHERGTPVAPSRIAPRILVDWVTPAVAERGGHTLKGFRTFA